MNHLEPKNFAAHLRALAAPALAGTPFDFAAHTEATDAEKRSFLDTFSDGAGNRRPLDTPLLASMLGIDPGPRRASRTGAESGARCGNDLALWWALHDDPNEMNAAGDSMAATEPVDLILTGPGPLTDPVNHPGIEIFTETEMAAIHALDRIAAQRSDAALAERALEAARWLVEEIQPDNATNRPWAVHAIWTIARIDQSIEADLYLQTLLHNVKIGARIVDGSVRIDRFSAVLLEDAARAVLLSQRS